MNQFVFGRHIYAIGGNLHAAQLSGVKTKRVDFLLFVNMGVLAGIAGMVFTARINSALPGAGTGFELDAIAAAFIGGAAVTGGIGTVTGAIDRRPDHGRAEQRHVDARPRHRGSSSSSRAWCCCWPSRFDIFNKRRAANASK